ncbi:hypothetical protein C1646_322062 [Rhizophagus diaphanus]|nr:hypothetical protein C1646_322062 [Rhizophagus diaphanus] [Rhizophagus sp. MUCL 43196]
MQPLYELNIEFFKFVHTPLPLILTNRQWYTISKDPHARAEWLINKYGLAHALFHAVRLGNSFITPEVIQALLSKKAILSRYFVQRLLMHFGNYDEKLIELKIEHNVNQVDFDRIRAFQKKLQSPWASNLPLPIFTKLITEGYSILNDQELATKGNDMELFHFLSAGPLVINFAPQKLLQNINEIKDLIINKKFIPFPPRPKPTYEDTVHYIQLMQARAHEEYPPKDGYENSRQLNVVARAILIHPDLVLMWKEIGYHEICNDVNELVMQGALLILFPPTPPSDWECPGVRAIVTRLNQLIDLGFKLTDTVMEEAFHLFEHRLSEIGDTLMSAFQVIRKESKSAISTACLIKAIKPERSHKKTNLLEFLVDRIDQPEEALETALNFYNVGFKLDVNDVDSIKTIKIRSLSVHSNLYYWILKTYGSESRNTQKCFEDIIESRIWVDLKLQESPERDVPEHLTSCAYNSICSIYLEFCNEKVPFKRSYLPYLQLADNDEIIRPLFGISLPKVFGLDPNIGLPLEITYSYNRPEVRLVINNKRKFNDMNDLDNQQKNEAKEWFRLLKKLHYLTDPNITQNFKNSLGEFWERITTSQDPEIQSLINNENSENDENNEKNKVYVSEQYSANSSKRIKQ